MTKDTAAARFIGEDGSLGYRHGEWYELRFLDSEKYPAVIERLDGSGRCPYGSLTALLRNWDFGPMTPDEVRREIDDLPEDDKSHD